MDSIFSAVVVAITALVPGANAWWSGRHLAHLTDDPALPELLLARRQRALKVFAGSLAIMLVLGGRHLLWGVPLFAINVAAGNYPLRRALGLETATVPRYAWRTVKSLLGGLGFWLLLALTPQIVFSIDWPWRLLSLLLVPFLLAWEHWYSRVWLWAHDAVPLQHPEVERRVAEIARRAGTPAPPLYCIGGKDAKFVNAVAIPSSRHPAIGIGNAVVELLEPDEVAAIYAHELSHHEQHSPRSLRRAKWVNRALILLAVGFPFAIESLAPSSRWPTLLLWPFVLVVVLALRARNRKQHETESDLRAAALCGDAEIVARALMKLHVHALIPRRWPVDFERQATHPSLARRIQALRGGGANAIAALGAPVILTTARPGSVVVFDDERAHWFDGVPADVPNDVASLRAHASSARSVMWPELIELRVATTGTHRALKATHRGGETWSVPLEPAQVSKVQRALDRVDVRLDRELGRRSFPDVRLIAIAALFAMLWSGDMGVLVVPAGLAALWPSTAALAALGAMASASAVLDALRNGWLSGDTVLPLALLAGVGVFALWRAWYRLRTGSGTDTAPDDRSRTTLLVLGGLLAVVMLLVITTAIEVPASRAVQLPIVATLAITLGGVAASLYTSAARRTRSLAAMLGVAGVIAVVPTVRAADVFHASLGVTRTHVAARETGRVTLPRTASDVRLSPDGEWFLARHYEVSDDEEEGRFLYTLGSATARPRDVRALQAEFVGAHRLLALRRVNDTLALELQDADSGATLWRQVLPRVSNPRLAVSPHEATWIVSGMEAEGTSPLVVAGSVGSSATIVRHLRPADAAGLAMGGVVGVGKRIIVPAYDFKRSAGMLTAFGMTPLRVGLWEVDDASRRQIGEMDGVLECGASDGGYALCLVRQRGRTEVWTLGPVGKPSLVTRLPLLEVVRSSIGPGRRLTSVPNGKGVIIVDAAARNIAEVEVTSDSAYAVAAASVPGRLAVLWRGDAATALTFYDIPAP